MKTITINDKLWIYDPTDELNEDEEGRCEYEDRPIGGFLKLDKYQCGPEFLDTIIHEWLHALLPNADEEWVRENATNITSFIKDKKIVSRIGMFNNIIVTE